MTSSLVGSEMCIRDRSCTGCGSSAASNRPRPFPGCGYPAAGVQAWCRAVSYTHLTLPTICSV
eukprot:10297600-Prorocentrum_lima.AAC.1